MKEPYEGGTKILVENLTRMIDDYKDVKKFGIRSSMICNDDEIYLMRSEHWNIFLIPERVKRTLPREIQECEITEYIWKEFLDNWFSLYGK